MRCLAWRFEDAVIAHVVEDWYEQTGEYIDRTVLQRLMYFLKASGVPLAINHRIHYYGPYSHEVTDRIEWLEIRDVIQNNSSNSRSQYRPGTNAQNPIREYCQKLLDFKHDIDEVMRELSQQSPRQMELLASVSFVQGTAMRGDDNNDERTIREIRRIKGSKFDSQEIEDTIAYLRNSLIGLRKRDAVSGYIGGYRA